LQICPNTIQNLKSNRYFHNGYLFGVLLLLKCLITLAEKAPVLQINTKRIFPAWWAGGVLFYCCLNAIVISLKPYYLHFKFRPNTACAQQFACVWFGSLVCIWCAFYLGFEEIQTTGRITAWM